MRELVAACATARPSILLVDPDTSKGGLSVGQIETLLGREGLLDSYTKWGFDPIKDTPRGPQLLEHLLRGEPIEWARLSAFQDVTMRKIAARILSLSADATYVEGEMVNRQPIRMSHD